MNRTVAIVLGSVVMLGASCSIQPRVQDGGVYRSDDVGSTWVQKVFVRQDRKSTVRIDTTNVREFRFDSEGAFYAITFQNGVWRSDNHADSWTALKLAASPADFTIDPDSTSIQYAAIGQTVQRSADAGATWRSIYAAPRPGEAVVGITVDPTDPTHLLIVTSAGSTVESRDSGSTWTVVSFQKFGFKRLTPHPRTARVLYAVTTTGPVQTVDGGTTWTNLKERLKAFPHGDEVNQIVLSSENPSQVYLASNAGLLVSVDDAQSWSAVPTLIPQGTAVSLVAVRDSRTILFVTANRLQRTDDGGANWSTPAVGTTRLLTALSYDPIQRSTVYLGLVRPAKK